MLAYCVHKLLAPDSLLGRVPKLLTRVHLKTLDEVTVWNTDAAMLLFVDNYDDND